MTLPEILDQYPKAKAAFDEWKTGSEWELLLPHHLRNLTIAWGVWLKFFDDQGIVRIVIEIEAGISPVCEFHPCIHCDLEIYRMPGNFDTRESAQLAALTAALSILEGRL